MAKVTWSPSALDDIDSIAKYIAENSAEVASLFVRRLMEATDRLQDFPLSGRMVPEVGDPNSREVIYGAYRVMYRVEGDEVWITGVVYGARDWRHEQSRNEEGNE